MSKTILIFDEEPLAQKLLQIILETSGYMVRTARNMEEAFSEVKSSAIDLIVLDVNGSLQDGLTSCRALRSQVHSAHLPIVLLSNCAHDEANMLSLDAGATVHLYKPVSRKQLVQAIHHLNPAALPAFE